METSERIVSGNGHALVRFNKTLPRHFRAHESYISLAVRRISLKKGRVNLSKYGPYLFGVVGQTNFDAQTRLAGVFAPAIEDTLLAGASTQTGSQVGTPLGPRAESLTENPNGPSPLQAETFSRLDRVLLVDRQLTPRLVYRGEGPLQLGFGGVLQKDHLADALGVLEGVAKSPAAQFVSATSAALGLASSAIDLAGTVHRAFNRLEESKGMERFALMDLNLRALFDDTGSPQDGLYALFAEEDVPDNLVFDPTETEILTKRGGVYDDAPYVVFELRCEATRPDWGSVPEVNTAWRTLEHQITNRETAGALETFRRALFLSPDLVPADSERIYRAARQKLGPLLSNAESFGLARRLGTAMQVLSSAVEDLKATSLPIVNAVRDEWASFHRCHSLMRVNEGGYINHPDDPGGSTNMGVTQYTYDRWRMSRTLPTTDVRNITETEVQQIYFEGYWRAYNCHEMPSDAIALLLFDATVNHGPTHPMKFIQRGAGLPVSQQDGLFGPATRAAIERAVPENLIHKALDARWGYYELVMRRDPQLESFRNGWRNRVERVRQTALQWISGQESLKALPLLSPHAIIPPAFVLAPQGAQL
ncbi:MAG: glycosyl hydrolase 108 family protein [Pseudomonadota bacterium]